MSHIRDEADLTFNAFKEAIRIGREAKIPVQISHIKIGTVGVWGKAGSRRKLIERRSQRQDWTSRRIVILTTRGHSTITVLVPSRKHDDAATMIGKGLADVGGGAKM